MANLQIKGAAAEGKEKHVPIVSVNGDVVTVEVGVETAHPNTLEHYIAWAEIYGLKGEAGLPVLLGRAEFTAAATHPKAEFKVLNLSDFKAVKALSYCNIHGLWEGEAAL